MCCLSLQKPYNRDERLSFRPVEIPLAPSSSISLNSYPKSHIIVDIEWKIRRGGGKPVSLKFYTNTFLFCFFLNNDANSYCEIGVTWAHRSVSRRKQNEANYPHERAVEKLRIRWFRHNARSNGQLESVNCSWTGFPPELSFNEFIPPRFGDLSIPVFFNFTVDLCHLRSNNWPTFDHYFYDSTLS